MAFSGKMIPEFYGWAIKQQVEDKGETEAYNIRFMTEDHYQDLYDIQLRTDEPFNGGFEEFVKIMKLYPGFTMFHEGRIVGCISFGDYLPGHSIAMHLTIDPDDGGEWSLSPREYHMVFGYCFEALQVRRVSAGCIPGVHDRKAKFLQKLGFTHEGTLREMVKHTDGNYHDIKLYGLLKNEQKGNTACQ